MNNKFSMRDLEEKIKELSDNYVIEQNKVNKTKQEMDGVSIQISELKERFDYGSFKFVHRNMGLILQKIAPKHKVPPPHEVVLSSNSDVPSLKATIPWAEEKCSDENACNVTVCPRCTLLHFKKVLDRLLAEYYTK